MGCTWSSHALTSSFLLLLWALFCTATTLFHWQHTTAPSIYQSLSIKHYPHHPHLLKQSRYQTCRSNFEAGRLNPSWDLSSVTNSKLTARTVKALEDSFYSLWCSTAKRLASLDADRPELSEVYCQFQSKPPPIWNSGRCLRLLWHSVGTTTKFAMVEHV